MLPGPIAAQVVLYNSLWNRQFSGLQLVLAGGKLAPVEAWLDGWENSKAATVGKGSKFTTALLLAPNNLPFPSSAVPTCGAALPVADLTAVMSAVYGSPAGALVSHKFAPEGRITPCIGTPGRCYGYAHAAVLLLSVVTCDLTLSRSRVAAWLWLPVAYSQRLVQLFRYLSTTIVHSCARPPFAHGAWCLFCVLVVALT